MLHTNHEGVSVFLINDPKVFRDLNKNKQHLSKVMHDVFENLEALIEPIEADVWMPCFSRKTNNLKIEEVLSTFGYSLNIPIKLAECSYQIELLPSGYPKGVKIKDSPTSLLFKPPFIFGLLSSKLDETVKSPLISLVLR